VIPFRIFAAACALAFMIQPARAVTFDVIGTNIGDDSLSGTLEADTGLTTVAAANLIVSGTGGIPDGAYAYISSSVSYTSQCSM
jgi:hypothetical protein